MSLTDVISAIGDEAHSWRKYAKEHLRLVPAKVLLGTLKIVYRRKDRELSELLHEAAGDYQTHPGEGWHPFLNEVQRLSAFAFGRA